MFLHFITEAEHKAAFMELAHRIANSDGFMNRNEWHYIQGWMLELGLESWEPQADDSLSTADLVGHLKDESLKRIFLAEMLLLIFADGNYNDEEKRIAEEMRQLFRCDEETFGKFRSWVESLNKLKVEGMKLILDA
ncbi:TerB family tellurite resistance protein [Paenibacillus sp. PL2-23]|uniref:TerB family tellurite resistance protein n=1 Tax=Paenibacillus sp. PL2-23 TaxID=2100729 RepID=UPI0030F72C96